MESEQFPSHMDVLDATAVIQRQVAFAGAFPRLVLWRGGLGLAEQDLAVRVAQVQSWHAAKGLGVRGEALPITWKASQNWRGSAPHHHALHVEIAVLAGAAPAVGDERLLRTLFRHADVDRKPIGVLLDGDFEVLLVSQSRGHRRGKRTQLVAAGTSTFVLHAVGIERGENLRASAAPASHGVEQRFKFKTLRVLLGLEDRHRTNGGDASPIVVAEARPRLSDTVDRIDDLIGRVLSSDRSLKERLKIDFVVNGFI